MTIEAKMYGGGYAACPECKTLRRQDRLKPKEIRPPDPAGAFLVLVCVDGCKKPENAPEAKPGPQESILNGVGDSVPKVGGR